MAHDKNVFILGAGASAGSGAPVIKDFLQRARELLDNPESGLDEAERKAFRRIFAWRSEMSRCLMRINIDLYNVEELFSLADMSYQLGVQRTKNVIDDLTMLVSRTLELLIQFQMHKEVLTDERILSDSFTRYMLHDDDVYQRFLRVLLNRNRHNIDESELDCIITLNYDTAIDWAFQRLEVDFRYCHAAWDSGMNTEGYKLLKLHGSANWGMCTVCKHKQTEMTFFPHFDEEVKKLRNDTKAQPRISARCAKMLYATPCPACGKGTLRPFIVPPTWNKGVYREGLESVWQAAREALTQANRLFIVGYSLPETDTFFKYLLASGLWENESLQRIFLIDPALQPSPSNELYRRYSDFIAPFFAHGKLVIWPKDFRAVLSQLSSRQDGS